VHVQGELHTFLTMHLWNAFPPELMEAILCYLSLLELTRVAPICQMFRDVFRRKVAREQEALCDKAGICFGHNRIKCVAAAIERFLMGEAVHSDVAKDVARHFWMCGNGEMHVEGVLGRRKANLAPVGGNIRGVIWLVRCTLQMTIGAPGLSEVYLSIRQDQQHICISIGPCHDDDFEGVALVYALVTGAFGPRLANCGFSFDIHIKNYKGKACTYAGLKAQVAPLRLWAAGYARSTSGKGGNVGRVAQGIRFRVEPW
jgi:hypothetical protein